jgi:predicted anti-sigma-YlaC factor YlaD
VGAAAIDASAPGAPADTGRTRRDARLFASSSALSLVAAALVGVSTVLPWRSIGAHHQTAFQFGPGWFGWSLLGCAATLLLASVVMVTRALPPNVCMPLAPALLALIVTSSQWSGPLYNHPGAGVLVCFLGVVCGVAAGALLLPAERPASR